MWENAYLSIKNPKASRALKQALDPSHRLAHFIHTTLLCYVSNIRLQKLGGGALDQILDPHLEQRLKVHHTELKSEYA